MRAATAAAELSLAVLRVVLQLFGTRRTQQAKRVVHMKKIPWARRSENTSNGASRWSMRG